MGLDTIGRIFQCGSVFVYGISKHLRLRTCPSRWPIPDPLRGRRKKISKFRRSTEGNRLTCFPSTISLGGLELSYTIHPLKYNMWVVLYYDSLILLCLCMIIIKGATFVIECRSCYQTVGSHRAQVIPGRAYRLKISSIHCTRPNKLGYTVLLVSYKRVRKQGLKSTENRCYQQFF